MLILAAGSSSRMGQPKQLLAWKETNLLNHTIEKGLNAGIKSIYVVLGNNAKQISDTISFDNINIINNALWKKGMGTSISVAVKHIMNESKKCDAVLIALVDQPLLDQKHYNELIVHYLTTKNEIIATQMVNNGGVPAIFDLNHFGALMQLNQDIGAKEIIISNKNNVLTIDPIGQFVDIDNLETYNTLYKEFGE